MYVMLAFLRSIVNWLGSFENIKVNSPDERSLKAFVVCVCFFVALELEFDQLIFHSLSLCYSVYVCVSV